MHRQPSSRNFAFHFLILLKTGAAFRNYARNRHCTVTTDKVLAYSKTQNDCSSLLNAIFANTVFWRQIRATMCAGFSLKRTWRVFLSIGLRITMIRYIVYLLRIFKMFHGLMNNLVYCITYVPVKTQLYLNIVGGHGGIVVKALCYKPSVCEFNS